MCNSRGFGINKISKAKKINTRRNNDEYDWYPQLWPISDIKLTPNAVNRYKFKRLLYQGTIIIELSINSSLTSISAKKETKSSKV